MGASGAAPLNFTRGAREKALPGYVYNVVLLCDAPKNGEKLILFPLAPQRLFRRRERAGGGVWGRRPATERSAAPGTLLDDI
jgi:hypothetical protein